MICFCRILDHYCVHRSFCVHRSQEIIRYDSQNHGMLSRAPCRTFTLENSHLSHCLAEKELSKHSSNLENSWGGGAQFFWACSVAFNFVGKGEKNWCGWGRESNNWCFCGATDIQSRKSSSMLIMYMAWHFHVTCKIALRWRGTVWLFYMMLYIKYNLLIWVSSLSSKPSVR